MFHLWGGGTCTRIEMGLFSVGEKLLRLVPCVSHGHKEDAGMNPGTLENVGSSGRRYEKLEL